MHKVMGDRRMIALLVAPGLFLFVGLVLLPIVMSGYYGMTDWGGFGGYKFIGLQNYVDVLFHDPTFWRSLYHAVLLAVATLLLQHPLAIFTAILLTHCGKWEKPLRIILFIPAVISIVVTAKMWAAVFSPEGALNRALELIGLQSWKQDWLGDPHFALPAILFVVMWQGFGYALLLYYAGLQAIPKYVHEAAQLDGATNWKLYTKVIVPMLSPMMKVAVVIAVVTCLKQMETVYLMTNGGPGDQTQFLGNYLYSKAFTSSMFGYGNAISVIFAVFCLAITALINRVMNKDVGEF